MIEKTLNIIHTKKISFHGNLFPINQNFMFFPSQVGKKVEVAILTQSGTLLYFIINAMLIIYLPTDFRIFI